jgi:hypothetical protein|tara:strand:- start:1616 stop:2014 length:399 start_codon:yes stop_codon:yes gene_type:complete
MSNADKQWEEQYQEGRDPKSGKFVAGKAVGRKKGSRNKGSKVSASEKLRQVEEQLGVTVDPLEGMARIAVDPNSDVQTQLSALRELAKYVYPQRKAVDMSIEEDRGEATAMSDTDLESIIQGQLRVVGSEEN